MAQPQGVSTVQEIESTPAGKVRRWLGELEAARRREKHFHEESEKVWDLYRSKNPADNTFNIFWSNTETLRPGLYNSLPRPDVRRRFRDEDPVGRVASNILERGLTYTIDAEDFNFTIEMSVLDVCIPGRMVARVRYEPVFAKSDSQEAADWLEEAPEDPAEEVVDESATIQHVQWDEFLHGEGKAWPQVQWVSFKHCFTYEELAKKFGKAIADKVSLSEVSKDEGYADKDVRSLKRSAEVYEIWDKLTRSVLFITESVKQPLMEVDDPLRLQGFFPVPRPVYFIEDSSSLVPAVPYVKYKQQATELNRITKRINKVIEALKVRGAYTAALSEVYKVIEANDNEMIPIENVSEVANMGGLDKAIWIMPIDRLVQVLEGLYVARQNTIQSIYEITGLGDVMRGVSNPHETLGAQKIKSQWGTLRLQRLQREIQRFIRDLLRLQAEVIGEHFAWETISAMTNVKLLTQQQKQEIQMRMQPQPGLMGVPQPPPPMPPELEKLMAQPSVEEVMALLKGDNLRAYRIDIETDSTVAETVSEDVQGMQEVVTGIVNLFSAAAPALEQGLVSVDVVKSIATAMTRRAKMGDAVEDALDQIKQPPPKPQGGDPEAAKQMQQLQAELQKKSAEVQQSQQTIADMQMKQSGMELDKKQMMATHQLAERQREQAAELEKQKQAAMQQLQAQQQELAALVKQIEAGRHDLELKKKDLAIDGVKLDAKHNNIKAAEHAFGASVNASKKEQDARDADGRAVEAEKKVTEVEEDKGEMVAEVQSLKQMAEKLAAGVDDLAAAVKQQGEQLAATQNRPKSMKAFKDPKTGTWKIEHE